MVAEDEQLIGCDRPLGSVRRRVGGLVRLCAREDVPLGERLAVYHDLPVTDRDGIASQTDDTLDERRVAALVVAGGRRENDHVAAAVVVESGGQLVDQDVLAGLERILHRHLLDLVRLGHEILDDEKNDEGQDKCLDDLEETPKRALAHKSGSIGAVLSSCPVTPSRRRH